MTDEESYAVGAKAEIDEPLPLDADKPVSAKDLEPFGNEETAEVKYRTMQWWYVQLILRERETLITALQALWNA
ncbi:hypothetical protein N7492_006693 [Penicillium capsulatum]|uniref:Uncharacterized protein n=1 Tax=Penicillium capsulatum TaxID=69766 RepID=A0A9W9I0X7_9EURO|nr:hypothetical protein N7492_006693 [Penicillium capsulatum]KAJ6116529.1 hypothetical protein N7512_006254 [Penicillium capsulatum]